MNITYVRFTYWSLNVLRLYYLLWFNKIDIINTLSSDTEPNTKYN